MSLLSIFVAIPVLMLLLLLLSKRQGWCRGVMVGGSGALVVMSVVTAILYTIARGEGATDAMLFTASVEWYPALGIAYSVGADGVTIVMLLLSSVVSFAGIFSSWNMTRDYFVWYVLLAVGVFGFFVSTDMAVMFLFYEVALIPMYLLIGVWGTGRKEYAAMKLTLMLMGGSALLLTGLLALHFLSPTLSWNILNLGAIPAAAQSWIFPITFMGFGVLGALFPFHTWSPDGHASAPTAVSMLHAGVLMKLGGYGCFRIAISLMPEGAEQWSWVFLILTGLSVIYGALGAVVQKDLKYINAYSSVSHCGLVLFALLLLREAATRGAILQMLSHGLMTALFFALIGVVYSRTHTRDIRAMGGLMRLMPFAGVCYVIAGMASLGLPGLSGFVAEMTIFTNAFSISEPLVRVLTIVAICSIVVTAVYILRTIGKVFYGTQLIPQGAVVSDARWYERLSAIVLIVCIVAIGVAPQILNNLI